MTTTEVIAVLRKRQGRRSLKQFGKEVGCSAAYLSKVMTGEDEPGPVILRYLGLARSVSTTYAKAERKRA